MYKANKGVVVLVNLYSYLTKRQNNTVLTKNMVHLIPISDDDCEEEATWAEFGQNEDQSKYFGVEASVFHSQLV